LLCFDPCFHLRNFFKMLKIFVSYVKKFALSILIKERSQLPLVKAENRFPFFQFLGWWILILTPHVRIKFRTKIDPYVKNFLTYDPTLNSAIDRSRRALQLCRGNIGEWVRSHLHFSSILDFEKGPNRSQPLYWLVETSKYHISHLCFLKMNKIFWWNFR